MQLQCKPATAASTNAQLITSPALHINPPHTHHHQVHVTAELCETGTTRSPVTPQSAPAAAASKASAEAGDVCRSSRAVMLDSSLVNIATREDARGKHSEKYSV